MPSRKKQEPAAVKKTRAFLAELSRPIAERRKTRVSTQFPAMNSYTALPDHPGVSGARKNGHLFIRFDRPIAQTVIPVTGHYNTDAAEAERRTGRTATALQVWHHVADINERRMGTIQLVPLVQHASIGHWGGSAITRRYALAHTGIALDSHGKAVAVHKPRRSRF